MVFPKTWEEYKKSYGIRDDKEVYTNGSLLIPTFRVEQWLEHNAWHNGWHTGTPEEYGLYLVQYTHGGYDVVLFDPSASGWDIYSDDSPKDIVAWKKIEPFEETE